MQAGEAVSGALRQQHRASPRPIDMHPDRLCRCDVGDRFERVEGPHDRGAGGGIDHQRGVSGSAVGGDGGRQGIGQHPTLNVRVDLDHIVPSDAENSRRLSDGVVRGFRGVDAKVAAGKSGVVTVLNRLVAGQHHRGLVGEGSTGSEGALAASHASEPGHVLDERILDEDVGGGHLVGVHRVVQQRDEHLAKHCRRIHATKELVEEARGGGGRGGGKHRLQSLSHGLEGQTVGAGDDVEAGQELFGGDVGANRGLANALEILYNSRPFSAD